MRLLLAAVVTGLVIVIFFWARAIAGQSTCEVVKTQVEQGIAAIDTPGSPGYAYYLDHPDERDAAIAQSEALRDKLPC